MMRANRMMLHVCPEKKDFFAFLADIDPVQLLATF
jgi:hypothetical protein